mmetsp:Transcript_2188/g.5403  ORF Transcript_2188/g.5403 Transcript_2188/m.5403 type:complete len:315 (-) Transcript_2188:148-1092(-)
MKVPPSTPHYGCDWLTCRHSLTFKSLCSLRALRESKTCTLHTAAHVRGPPAKSALMHLLTLPGRHISPALRCLNLQVTQDKLHALTALGGDLLVHTVQGTDDQASFYHELRVEAPLASASTEEFLLPSTTMEHPSVFIRLVASTLSSVCARVSSRSSSTSRPNSSSKCTSPTHLLDALLAPLRSPRALPRPASGGSALASWRRSSSAHCRFGSTAGAFAARWLALSARSLASAERRLPSRSWCESPRETLGARPTLGLPTALRSGFCGSPLRARQPDTSSSKSWETSSSSPHTRHVGTPRHTQFLISLFSRSTL